MPPLLVVDVEVVENEDAADWLYLVVGGRRSRCGGSRKGRDIWAQKEAGSGQ